VRRLVRALVLAVAAFVVLALGLDAMVAVFQPTVQSQETECVLRTFDENGKAHENRLALVEDGGTLWIQSGHHFRGWYHRLVRNPDVELVRNGEVRAYHAVPIDTPETEARMKTLMKQRSGALRFYLIRTLLLFPDMKPVRLDPREASPLGDDRRQGM
jgi:hypothetical protein